MPCTPQPLEFKARRSVRLKYATQNIALFFFQWRFSRRLTSCIDEKEAKSVVSHLLSALTSCTSLRDLELGARIHQHSSHLQFTDVYIGNNLINMFIKCGSLSMAKDVFEAMDTHNVVTWNSLISGYVTNGQSSHALKLFQRMTEEGWSPSSRTFVAALMACSSLAVEEKPRRVGKKLVKGSTMKTGMDIHSLVVAHGSDRDVYVGSTLVNMYSRCGAMFQAQRAFDRIETPSTVAWNALIQGYTENNLPELALNVFTSMQEEPDTATFLAAVKACTRIANKEDGRIMNGNLLKVDALEKAFDLHSRVLLGSQLSLENALVDLYGECRSMVDARTVFDRMKYHDVVSWTSLLLGYVENDQPDVSLRLFECMDCEPNARTYVAVFKACSSMAVRELNKDVDGEPRSVERGMLYHSEARSKGLDTEVFVANALVDMYSKCRSMSAARTVFDAAVNRDVVLWNSLILGYAENDQGELALKLFHRMQSEPNARSYVAALVAIGSLTVREQSRLIDGELVKPECLNQTKTVHLLAASDGLETELYVASSLVSVYSKCGSMEGASKVFVNMVKRSVVAWNSLVLGYVDNNDPVKALQSFRCMQLEGWRPNGRTFVAGLMACSTSAKKDMTGLIFYRAGTEIQSQAAQIGLDRETYVANTLIDMHSKFGCISEAEAVFCRMSGPTVVSWNALILAYAENSQPERALEVLSKMVTELGEVGLDTQTFLAAFKACSCLGALETGTSLHALACKQGRENFSTVANSLVDFYGNCGSLVAAELVFNSMTSTTSVSWSSLISTYSNTGDANRTIELLDSMVSEGIQPDGITFSSALSACSRAGRVDDGKNMFSAMVTRFRIQPESEHFHCMIDMLGRANQLEEALTLVENMPFKPTSVTWTMILGAAYKWRNLRAGELAFRSLVRVDPDTTAGYELMANIYGSLGMWEEKEELNRRFSRRRVLKPAELARFW